mmetsp:Transcript_70284/g.201393  ORF Transcript_70284/g.201393 Transcript_70284/m.201393 type:complete len:281 (-) Transcript_70284:83-925(-)
MGALLVGALGLGTIEVPDLHHVRVRPAARPGQRVRAVVVRQRGVSLSQDAPEVSRDVAAGTVHVHRTEAALGIRRTVVAVFDPHSLPALVEELSESRHVDRISTAVNLDTVEAHGEEPSDVLLVVGRGLVLHADAGIQIASNLQTQGVPVLDQAVHVGEAMQVDHRQASHLIVPRALSPDALVNRALGQRRIFVLPGRAVALLPSIIHADPAKAQIFQTERFASHAPRRVQHRSHGTTHVLVVDDAGIRCAIKGVPGSPAPRWSLAKTIIDATHDHGKVA